MIIIKKYVQQIFIKMVNQWRYGRNWFDFVLFKLIKDPFGDRRGQFEYSTILTRLNKLKSKLENNDSSNEQQQQQQTDPRTREIMNDAAALYTNLTSTDNVTADLDDIFDEDADEDGEEEDDNMEQSEENPSTWIFVIKNKLFSLFYKIEMMFQTKSLLFLFWYNIFEIN